MKKKHIALAISISLLFIFLLFILLDVHEKRIESVQKSYAHDIFEKNKIELGNRDTLESIISVPQEYNTFFDGDEKTRAIINQNINKNDWEEYFVKDLNLYFSLPKKVLVYKNLESDGCVLPLVIEDETTNYTSPVILHITPELSSCENKVKIKSHNGINEESWESKDVFVLKAESTEEIKGFIKGLLMRRDKALIDECPIDELALVPSFQSNGFQYFFPILPEDSRSVYMGRQCGTFRLHIKYHKQNGVAIIMSNSGQSLDPEQIPLSAGGMSRLPLDRVIFEDIRFEK